MKEVRQECGMEETSSEEEDLAGQCITGHVVVVSHRYLNNQSQSG